jgi:hypothetical protein
VDAILVRAEVLSEVCVVVRFGGLMRDLKQRIAGSRKELLRLLERRNLSFNRRLRIGDLLGIMGDLRLEGGPVEKLHWVKQARAKLEGRPIISREFLNTRVFLPRQGLAAT